jgi:tRNA A-37 threonylcarbamoyl transferase component Bud32
MAQDQGHLLGRRYRLVSVVGRGGMGTVWRAHDEVLGRDVAVKEVRYPPGLTTDEERILYERTFREARASARLNHPGVVTVHDVVEEYGRPWIVMEFVRARSLQNILDEEGPLTPARAAEFGHQTLSALHHAHTAGVLHRDVKPSNVLITGDGRVVLTDFGIAQSEGDTTLTQTGLVMGSPNYIPPERAQGERAMPASDLWALGATLYAAVEGGPPYEREDAVAALAAALIEPVPTPRNAGPLRPVLDGLLTRDPAYRISAGEALPMLRAVARAGGGADPPGAVRPPTPPPPPSPPAPAARGAARPDDATMLDPPPGGFGDADRTVRDAASLEVAHWSDTRPRPQATARRRERAKTAVIVVIAAILVVAALITGLILRSRWTSTDTTTGRETALSENGGGKGSGGSAALRNGAPAGYGVADEDGFGVAVPTGWTRRAQGQSVFWDAPGRTTFLQIDQTPWTGTPLQEAYRAEGDAPGDPGFPGYAITSIQGLKYQGVDAADWEFTFHDAARGTVRAKDRFVRLNGRTFALYFRAMEHDWSSAVPHLETAYRTFTAS